MTRHWLYEILKISVSQYHNIMFTFPNNGILPIMVNYLRNKKLKHDDILIVNLSCVLKRILDHRCHAGISPTCRTSPCFSMHIHSCLYLTRVCKLVKKVNYGMGVFIRFISGV